MTSVDHCTCPPDHPAHTGAQPLAQRATYDVWTYVSAEALKTRSDALQYALRMLKQQAVRQVGRDFSDDAFVKWTEPTINWDMLRYDAGPLSYKVIARGSVPLPA